MGRAKQGLRRIGRARATQLRLQGAFGVDTNRKIPIAVRSLLRMGGAEPGERVTFAIADLEKDEGWPQAIAGCDYVLHVASPFPATLPKDERELLRPAVEGTRRVLCAARDAGVKRVVVTSSFAAVGYGHPQRAEPFDETSWTNVESDEVLPYVKSKTLAERAAWDFIEAEGRQLELSVVNPVGVFGPVLGADYSTETAWAPGQGEFRRDSCRTEWSASPRWRIQR